MKLFLISFLGLVSYFIIYSIVHYVVGLHSIKKASWIAGFKF